MTTRPRVLLTNAIDPAAEARLREAADVVIAPDTKPDTLKRLVADADVLLVRAFLPPDIFENAASLRGVARHGVGLDMIPMEAATAKSIPVSNVPGSNAEAVAEHAIAGMLLIARRLHVMDRELRSRSWGEARTHSDASTELFGHTLGVLGLGDVGTRAAQIAHAGFRMRVLGTASRRRKAPDFVEVLPLEEILRQSDFVLLACPLTPETRNLMNAQRLAMMKPQAALINVARGPIVDEEALVAALREKRLRGAVLDVYTQQPLAADHALRTLDNVILTPHAAGITEESMKRMSNGSVEEALRMIRFERPVNLCNPEVWERHLARFGKETHA